jgi:energy-coupling factor transport system substrate-specific component
MTEMTMRDEGLWEITTRRVVYAAIGAALYAVGNWLAFAIQIPGAEAVSVRPHYRILIFFGFAFGPFVGFFVGLVGNMIGDQLTGWGAFTSWWWSVANGLAGLFAGLGAVLMAGMMSSLGGRAVAAAVVGVVATILGFAFIFIEFIIQPELGAETIIFRSYVPVVIANSIAAAIVTPILVLAWEPVRERIGR